MTFSPYTELHNYFYVVPKHFHFRTGEPVSIKQFLSFPVLPAPGNHPSVFCLCGLTSWRYFIQIDALQYVSFCIWLLAVSLILSRFIHEAAHVRISFFFMAKLYSIVFCATICLSIHLLRDTWVVSTFGFYKHDCYDHLCVSILFAFSILWGPIGFF